jgi:hypothetical protein
MSSTVPVWKALFGPSEAERKEEELMEEVLVEEAELSQGDQVLRMIARHLRGQEGWVVLDGV